MAEHNLAIIGGDGIGPEVVAEGKKGAGLRCRQHPRPQL